MADRFLQTYESSDFEVLVDAEVLHLQALAKSTFAPGKAPQQKQREQRSSPYSQRPSEPVSPPPWRAGPKQPSYHPPPAVSKPAVELSAPMVPQAASTSAASSSASWTSAPVAGSVAKKSAPVAAPAMMAVPPVPVAPPSASQPKQGGSEPPKQKAESEVDYLRRRLHNTQRGGRNRVYYHMLNLVGPKEAAKYWVEAPHKPPAKYANP